LHSSIRWTMRPSRCKELADELGRLRELFSRLHKNVAEQGWVYFRTEQIDILDAAVLRKFVSMYGLCHFPYREGVYLP
jgi:hypothetical protein